jgi:hypothetical protein
MHMHVSKTRALFYIIAYGKQLCVHIMGEDKGLAYNLLHGQFHSVQAGTGKLHFPFSGLFSGYAFYVYLWISLNKI